MRRFARPYAEALLAVADSVDKASQVRDELVRFEAAMEEVPALGRMAENPAIPPEAKVHALEQVAKKLALDTLTQRVLKALVVRYRLPRLNEIIAGIGELIDQRLGVAVAQVTSASPLDEKETEGLRSVLERKLEKKVKLELAVRPELLAGFVVQVGSTLYDASVRGQLARLTAELAEA